MHGLDNRLRLLTVLCLLLLVAACGATSGLPRREALHIQEQGSFAVGGKVVRHPGTFDASARSSDGQTLHGDHAYAFYQIPVQTRALPMVLWHGFGQFSKTWETTPDGREGYQNIFLRRGFSVYVLDQPRRGNAGRGTKGAAIDPIPNEQLWFNIFRIGNWPHYHPGVQFPQSPQALDQFFRQMTPDTGPMDLEANSDAVAALFRKIGPGILVTHSHSGGMGWATVLKSPDIRAVASYEPGSNFIFPEGEVPPPVKSAFDDFTALGVPQEDFMKLTRIPIVLYYGDYIPDEPSELFWMDQWRVRLVMARLWADAVNRHGGDVTLVRLPEIGIFGNTHFPFSDLNNLAVADLLSAWLAEKNLD